MKNLNKFFTSCLLILLLSLIVNNNSIAQPFTIDIPINGQQLTPPNFSTAVGNLTGTYDSSTNVLNFVINFNGLTTAATAANFHGPAPRGVNAPVQIEFAGFPAVVSGTYSNTYILTDTQEIQLLEGVWYVNICSSSFPNGELRGQLDEGTSPSSIEITLSGNQEAPVPTPSTGIGNLTFTYESSSNVLNFFLTYNGLTGITTGANFHGPAPRGVTAPVQIEFTGFPLGITAGAYSNSYVLTDTQEMQLLGGLWYVNIHTASFPDGEIRGQLEEGTLPVELSSFTAYVLKDNVTLNWSTQSETNNAEFNIETKLSSSSNWTKAGIVTGSGNTNELKNYSFSHRVSSGIYNYRLKQIDFNGNFQYYNLSNEVNVGLPSLFSMTQNYPNPFNPSTRIDFELPVDVNVNITLFDISGKEVLNLVNETKRAGYHTVQLNGGGLSSGIYFYNIIAGDFVQSKKMTIIK